MYVFSSHIYERERLEETDQPHEVILHSMTRHLLTLTQPNTATSSFSVEFGTYCFPIYQVAMTHAALWKGASRGRWQSPVSQDCYVSPDRGLSKSAQDSINRLSN